MTDRRRGVGTTMIRTGRARSTFRGASIALILGDLYCDGCHLRTYSFNVLANFSLQLQYFACNFSELCYRYNTQCL